jgi:mRNA-degrading endonuclease RelE of RelBE toxin-antitoxin system
MGEYRALVDVIFEKKLIKIQVLDHRSRIYKSRDRG